MLTWYFLVWTLVLTLSHAVNLNAGNIAPAGTGILGLNDAIDADLGTPHANAGLVSHINDENPTTRVDTWFGDNDQTLSYVGVLWPSTRYDEIQGLSLTLATFSDGGWFGTPGDAPQPGDPLLLSLDLIEPTVQVTSDGGTTWVDVAHTSDYLTTLDGHTIGGGANPNPTTATATFKLSTFATVIDGIRIIGPNGGNAGSDLNGFIGVFELEIDAELGPDTDIDEMPDSWETAHGLTVGINDAGDDPDNDGLSNAKEYELGTHPQMPDTDGDNLSDGDEKSKYYTDPLSPDTDQDGVTDGDEVLIHGCDPNLVDTDGDTLTDGDEVSIHFTKPTRRDTDEDTFSDSMEVAEGTDPLDPASFPSNAALTGTGIMGVNDAVDADTGTPRFHIGTADNINDGNLVTRVDNWFGDGDTDGGQAVSFVGIVWPAPLPTHVKSLTLTLATFVDGGWFGVAGNGPGAGGLLNSAYLSEPSVQISLDGGVTWSTVSHNSDYLSVMDGHGVGGGANPNPSTVSSTFTLSEPASSVTGIRIIGENGGNAGPDPNGFIGVFELEVIAGLADDVDNDGMDDGWETDNGLIVGVDDADDDPDEDGLSNIKEFAANTHPQNADSDADGLEDGAEVTQHNTNPVMADSDGDGLSDGAEVNTASTDPLVADSDGDGLSDGDEVNLHQSNPNSPDSDGDGFDDALEVAFGSDPNSAASQPSNVALIGTAILGTKPSLSSATDTPWANSGVTANINDANPLTRVDTYNGASTDTASYVGILWNEPITQNIVSLELTLAVFFDGGWFGVNSVGPGSGATLSSSSHLVEPGVQISTDGGTSWQPVGDVSTYMTALDGHPTPAVDFGAPTTATATFTLDEPQTGIDGIRIVGTEGGTASGGFLGVFELAVNIEATVLPQPVTLVNPDLNGAQLQFEFDSQTGVTYVIEYKDALSDAVWQSGNALTGDGTRQTIVVDRPTATRFYRVSTQ